MKNTHFPYQCKSIDKLSKNKIFENRNTFQVQNNATSFFWMYLHLPLFKFFIFLLLFTYISYKFHLHAFLGCHKVCRHYLFQHFQFAYKYKPSGSGLDGVRSTLFCSQFQWSILCFFFFSWICSDDMVCSLLFHLLSHV